MTRKSPRLTPALLLALAAFGAASLRARPAEARLIDLHAGAIAGGITGWGTTANTPDFFERRKGPGVGAEVGVKLLIFDLSANFLQVFDSNGRGATLSQLLLGVNIDVPVGNQRFQEGVERGKSRNVLRPIANIGGAVGSPEPVHLPIDNAQISSKGVVSYWGLGYEHFINEFMGVGAVANFGYHYFIGGGKSEDPMIQNQGHSSGYQLTGFATFTFHLGY
ncbi:MAG TPA: hypothetical protein VHL80_09720 [Polyangia bacterium]|nr:hypothetical protein [Polyangia bacterium]